jgi:hypothetical protein
VSGQVRVPAGLAPRKYLFLQSLLGKGESGIEPYLSISLSNGNNAKRFSTTSVTIKIRQN